MSALATRSTLTTHRARLALLAVVANAGILVHLLFGDVRDLAAWNVVDILGEGGSALLVLVWVVLMLKSRPAGFVTDLLFAGLGCLYFSLWMDAVDEFVVLPEAIGWDAWLESGPMPIGFVLLTFGIYHWHREQLAITAQMRNRERVFREHRLFDKLTPLGDADYLRRQIALALAQAAEDRQPLSLVMLDLDDFSAVNREFGHAEGDRALQVVTQLLLLNLRPHDLLCRLAGDRFVVLLPHTLENQALVFATELEQSVRHLACRTESQGARLHLSATAVALMARQDTPDSLLERLTLLLARARQPDLRRSA